MPATMNRRSILGLLGAAPLATSTVLTPTGRALAGIDGSRRASSSPSRVPDGLEPGGELDQLVADLAARDEFSGSLLLTYRGRTVLSRSYGMANKDREIPNGPDTIFALASLNKLFTAVAVAQLAQQDLVSFPERLGAYLDGFPAEIADQVTVHHMLTHASGLGDHMMMPGFSEASRSWDSPEEVMNGTLDFIRRSELAFPPGAGHTYSNAAFCLLGAIVERVSGQTYYDYIREHVFAAAEMGSSDFFTRPQWRDDPRIAHPYSRQDSGQRVDVVEDKPFMGSPAGDAFSTCADMDRFAHALLDDGRGDGLLDPAFRELVLSGKVPMPPQAGGPQPSETTSTPPSPEAPSPVAFQCYGWIGQLLDGHWAFGHGGGAPGTSTAIDMHPDREWVVVVLSNYAEPGANTVQTIAGLANRLINAS